MRSLSEAIVDLLGQALPGNASVKGKIVHCKLATGYMSAAPSRSVWVQFVPDTHTMIPLHQGKSLLSHTRTQPHIYIYTHTKLWGLSHNFPPYISFSGGSHSKGLKKHHSMPCCGGSQTQRWDTAPGAFSWISIGSSWRKWIRSNGPSLKVSFMISVRKFPPLAHDISWHLKNDDGNMTWNMTFLPSFAIPQIEKRKGRTEEPTSVIGFYDKSQRSGT